MEVHAYILVISKYQYQVIIVEVKFGEMWYMGVSKSNLVVSDIISQNKIR